MKLVVIESPFAGDVERNLKYVRAAMADALARGEAPYASHALYTQPGVLDDTKPDERKLGMEAGFAWGVLADRVAVYTDLGISDGMMRGVDLAMKRGRPVVWRSLSDWVRPCGERGARAGECGPIWRFDRCANCGAPDIEALRIFGRRYG